QRAELKRELSREAVATPAVVGAPRMGDATWVRPRLVAEVEFTEWTSDGRLRHPAFVGLRPDKSPMECVRETPAEPSTPPPAPAAGRARSPARASRRPPPPAPAAPSAPPSAARVALTHPERLLYPRDGITKQDLAGYYEAVAAPLLRALADRPLALEHWNDGI